MIELEAGDVPLLDAQRCERFETVGLQAERPCPIEHAFPERDAAVGRDIQLIREFAREAQPQEPQRHALDLDFADLSRADVKFVKITADLLLEQLVEIDGRSALRSLPDVQATDYAALTRRYGVEVIAEKVETERQVIDVLELEIGYGQGHLFGEPRAIRDSVLAETDPPADYIQGALRRTGR